MSRALITLDTPDDRARAARWCRDLPRGTRVEFKKTKRTLPQNARMWSMLTDVALQKEHCGRRYTPDLWKILMMHGCGLEVQMIPSLNNDTLIPWGQSSSDLSKEEMTDLIEFMFAWGAENGIIWSDPALRSLIASAPNRGYLASPSTAPADDASVPA
ncbi:recombination protein NinB [Rhodopseudomonas sp. P2A-2r]|nr:recombination protein NinB [Rhodopseudomonas sp. P2A-2r]